MSGSCCAILFLVLAFPPADRREQVKSQRIARATLQVAPGDGAVKRALATQFRIAVDPLATEGFGASKPLSPNDTPQGKANNRRVELVKI